MSKHNDPQTIPIYTADSSVCKCMYIKLDQASTIVCFLIRLQKSWHQYTDYYCRWWWCAYHCECWNTSSSEKYALRQVHCESCGEVATKNMPWKSGGWWINNTTPCDQESLAPKLQTHTSVYWPHQYHTHLHTNALICKISITMSLVLSKGRTCSSTRHKGHVEYQICKPWGLNMCVNHIISNSSETEWLAGYVSEMIMAWVSTITVCLELSHFSTTVHPFGNALQHIFPCRWLEGTSRMYFYASRLKSLHMSPA